MQLSKMSDTRRDNLIAEIKKIEKRLEPMLNSLATVDHTPRGLELLNLAIRSMKMRANRLQMSIDGTLKYPDKSSEQGGRLKVGAPAHRPSAAALPS